MEDGEESSSWTLKAVWRHACTPRCPHHPEEPATYFCCMLSWNEVETHTGSGLFLLLYFRVPHWVLALEHVLCVLFCEFEMRIFLLSCSRLLSTSPNRPTGEHQWTLTKHLEISNSRLSKHRSKFLHVGMLCGLGVSQGATCECPCICADSWLWHFISYHLLSLETIRWSTFRTWSVLSPTPNRVIWLLNTLC